MACSAWRWGSSSSGGTANKRWGDVQDKRLPKSRAPRPIQRKSSLLEAFQIVHQGFLLHRRQVGITGHFGAGMELARISEGYPAVAEAISGPRLRLRARRVCPPARAGRGRQSSPDARPAQPLGIPGSEPNSREPARRRPAPPRRHRILKASVRLPRSSSGRAFQGDQGSVPGLF